MSQTLVNIGLINPKSASNVAVILRAAGCFGVSSVFYTGARYGYAKQFNEDTRKIRNKIPCIALSDFDCLRPAGAKMVAVELTEGAVSLPKFVHPPNAYYVFGPEDGSIPQSVIDECDDVVYVPTFCSMNLAATVNVVLYDRLAKSHQPVVEDLIKQSRDKNNNTKTKNQRT